jgi:hypothetical protein
VLSATFSFNTSNHSAPWGLPATLPDQIAAAGAGYQYVGLDVPSLLAHEDQGLHPGQTRDCLKASAIGCFELVPLPMSQDQTPGPPLTPSPPNVSASSSSNPMEHQGWPDRPNANAA